MRCAAPIGKIESHPEHPPEPEPSKHFTSAYTYVYRCLCTCISISMDIDVSMHLSIHVHTYTFSPWLCLSLSWLALCRCVQVLKKDPVKQVRAQVSGSLASAHSTGQMDAIVRAAGGVSKSQACCKAAFRFVRTKSINHKIPGHLPYLDIFPIFYMDSKPVRGI